MPMVRISLLKGKSQSYVRHGSISLNTRGLF